jgi:nitric oxide reductase subunit B
MEAKGASSERLSPWWRKSVILIMIFGFAVLIWMAVSAHLDAPPIPEKVVRLSGESIFNREDILKGQQIFLKYGLMENGSIWGHGAYLGPDFSAEYLHILSLDTRETLAKQNFNRSFNELNPVEQGTATIEVQRLLKQNRYDPKTKILTFADAESLSYQNQITKWTAWASVTNRPSKSHSYTNNFPYDPTVGNLPTSDAILWSALSLITLLAGTAIVLFSFGRFDFLGWKRKGEHIHPQMLPGITTESQRATIKYFVIVALLFLAQALVGGATAHYRAEPGSFYGIDFSSFFPSNIFRTWHL